jgi:hypothetical protein
MRPKWAVAIRRLHTRMQAHARAHTRARRVVSTMGDRGCSNEVRPKAGCNSSPNRKLLTARGRARGHAGVWARSREGKWMKVKEIATAHFG